MQISGRIVALTASIVCVATLPGCGMFISSSSPDISCDWLTTSKPAKDAGYTVVLMDRSGSTRASGSRGPDYVAALEDVTKSAVDTHDVVFIGTFDGSASSVQWTAEKAVTDRGRTNPDNRRTDDEQAKTCLHEDLEKASSTQARTPGTDILGALAVGGQVLHDATGAKKIVLATDGLTTTGCADLTHVSVGDLAMINQIGQLCRQRATGLPDLSGISVTLIGVGHSAASQPLPSTLQLNWMALLWSGLCDGMKAKPCKVSTTPVPATDHDGSAEPAAVTDPIVSFPPPDKGISQPDGSVAYHLDSTVLFTPNDWVISPAGKASLTRIAADIKASGAGAVAVDGYTEAQASEQDNLTLAQHRAGAVQSFLAELGVGQVTAQGHSGQAPGCPPRIRDGQEDLQARQCNRRVDIVASAPHR